MPIKYAEITIVRNLEEESWLSYFKNLAGQEDIITINDTIIILFDDGTISDTKRDLVDKQFKFGPKDYHRDNYPIYFQNEDKNYTFFLKPSILKKETEPRKLFSYIVPTLNFNPIFKDYKNYNISKKETSIYNVIYECNILKDVFAIVKNGYNHRYLLAYEDSYFDKSDINYFINCLFTNAF